MTHEPTIKPLPRGRRRLYFSALLLVFIAAVPFLWLYATGYRFHNGTELVSTGGVYIGADSSGSEIYINNELVRETRTFRRGFYAQNLTPGLHRVHVQKEDHHTWVKELRVFPHRVTEAQAFNMPLEPEIREIPRFMLPDGTLLFEHSTSTATTTKAILNSPRATTTPNPEHTLVEALFATTTEAEQEVGAAQSLPDDLADIDLDADDVEGDQEDRLATTTKVFRDMKLFERGDEVYATWIGAESDVPYYFCTFSRVPVPDIEGKPETTAASSTEIVQECRDEIRMEDFYGREIYGFDFYPGNSDLVVLALEDGIYVEEIDDRGWQNIQPLHLEKGLDMRVHDGHIYIKDGEYIFEIITDV